MSHAMARVAIETALNTWAKARPVPCFFGPQKGDMTRPIFLRGFLLPAAARTECLQGDEITYTGLYQVTISLDPAQPMGNAESIVSAIQTLFPVDSLIGGSAFSGSITDAVDQGPTVYEESRYNVPVTIPYRGVVSN